jgi:PKD repeat protein
MRHTFLSCLFIAYGLLPVAVYSQITRPTAAISGGGEVCLGDSVKAYINFTGYGPWDAVINDKDGTYLELTEVETPYTLWLKPDETNTYYVAEVKDRYGRKGNTYGEARVTVYQRTPVEIIMDRTAFLYTEPGVPLYAEPAGGEFSGNGVTGGMFYPHIASPVGSPHRITYRYVNENGCASYDNIDLYVLFGEGEVYLIHEADTIDMVCSDEGTYLLRGTNRDGIPGTFELRLPDTQTVVEGHIVDEDLTDDMAVFHPGGLSGDYDIVYAYGFEKLMIDVNLRIRVKDLSNLEVSGVPDNVCKNDDPYLLSPGKVPDDPGAVYVFSGTGVSGNQAEGYYYHPAPDSVPTGENLIALEYTSSEGCEGATQKVVVNHDVPLADFSMSSVCLPEEGGNVAFENLTQGKEIVESWSWDFGDPDSGPDNFSNLEAPEHFYSGPRTATITLTATTYAGCKAGHAVDTVLSGNPVAGFTWLNDCFSPGRSISLVNTSLASYSAIDTLVYTFRDTTGSVIGEAGTGGASDTVGFAFDAPARYLIDLLVTNNNGCSDEVSREIILKPALILGPAGYAQSFDAAPGGWLAGSEDTAASWVWDIPDFEGFEQVPGDRAWYTDLPVAVIGYHEESWVESPCFDFSNSKRPLVQLDIMKSFVPGWNGAVLQYQDVLDEEWKTIGQVGEGYDWYNVSGLFNQPGGSNFGWGLEGIFDPDKEWITAKHDLDMIAGNPHVRFRLVIVTNGRQEIGNQGFAFDNVFVAERTKRSLLEHFTNSADTVSFRADAVVDQFAAGNPGDVIDIQYHMDYPGADPMYMNNPYPPSTRSFYYGLPGVPYALLDGGAEAGHRYDFNGPDHEPGSDALKMISLEIPVFDLDLEVDWQEHGLEATSTVTCRAQDYDANIQLYLAVIETAVTAYTGLNQDTLFRNVVLDMLPTPAGKLLDNSWYEGKVDTRTYSWDYSGYVEDVEDLAVVAFLQERDGGRILQADASYLTPQAGIGNYERSDPGSMLLYPNPTRDHLYIHPGVPSCGQGRFELTDLSGRVVMVEEVPPGFSVYRLDITPLTGGIYMVHWYESGMCKGRGKFIRLK